MVNRSTFVAPNYVLDTFVEMHEILYSDIANVNRYQQLLLQSSRTPSEEIEMTNLATTLQDKLVSAESWNKFQDSLTNMQTLIKRITNFQDKGDYSSITTYLEWNTVQYNGNTYMSKLDSNTGHTPVGGTSDLWWSLVAQKGEQGLRGETGYGVGLSPKEMFDSSTQYYVNDIVNYNGNLYYCILNSIGHFPTDINYWTLFLSGYGENLSNLQTDDKSGLVNAINEVNSNVDNHVVAQDPHSQYAFDSDLSALAGDGNTTTVKALADAHSEHLADFTQQIPYAVTGGSANTYTASTDPTLPALVAGVAITVKIHAQNTEASTLNWDGKGAKAINKANGSAVSSGNLKLNGVYTLRYDGASFILQGEGGEYGTATAPRVLAGYTIGTDAGLVSGTMLTKVGSGTVITPSAVDQAIPQGYFDGNMSSGKVKGIALEAGNLLWISMPNLRRITSDINTAVKNVNIDGTGVVRVKFEMFSQSASGTANAYITVNSVKVGTLRSTSSTTPVAYTEDIPVSYGDDLGITMYTGATWKDASIQNVEIRTTIAFPYYEILIP